VPNWVYPFGSWPKFQILESYIPHWAMTQYFIMIPGIITEVQRPGNGLSLGHSNYRHQVGDLMAQ